MSFDHRSRRDGISPGPGTAARENALAPGRRTLTESLPPQPQTSATQAVDENGSLFGDRPEWETVESEEAPRIEFPHHSEIVSALGVAVPGKAVHDPRACEKRGVPAFTEGAITRFASPSPVLHVAAHEAAHQLQHAGLTNDAGLGAEEHAHAVAEAVSDGTGAHGLIGGHGAAVAPSVRDYTVFNESEQAASNQWKAGGIARVGDEGRTITTDLDTHLCYADPALITESNAILAAKKSGVRIAPGAAGPSGEAPDGSGYKTTVKVDYKILSDEDNEEFYADCGHSAREVMGESEKDSTPHANYKDAAGNRRQTARSTNPADFRDEIFVRAGLGPNGPAAHAAYNALAPAEKDAFDKKHGINKYASPRVGEAFTRRRDDSLGGRGFNFHWGGVILAAGPDRVTFENYTKEQGYDAKDDEWYFATYGSAAKPGQTWHERWKSVGGAGKGTTVAAATSADPSPFTTDARSMATPELIRKYRASVDEGERMALESEMRSRWIRVTVQVKKSQEGKDSVYIKADHGGRSFQTEKRKMRSGDENIFWIPLDRLAPVTGRISIRAFEWDALSANDEISNIAFDAPFAPMSDRRPWDGAEYHTKVEFMR